MLNRRFFTKSLFIGGFTGLFAKLFGTTPVQAGATGTAIPTKLTASPATDCSVSSVEYPMPMVKHKDKCLGGGIVTESDYFRILSMYRGEEVEEILIENMKQAFDEGKMIEHKDGWFTFSFVQF